MDFDGLEDIEDIIGLDDDQPSERYQSRKLVIPKIRKHKAKKAETETPQEVDDDVEVSIIPGTQNIYVKTWGCSHNNSDGEYMAGQLAAYGYKIVDKKDEADLWLLNSCTVKNPAEDHFRNEIKSAHNLRKKVVVAGCVPQGERKSKYLEGLSTIGVQQIDRVVEVVEETLKGHSVRLFGQKKSEGKKLGGARLDLPKIRKNPLIEIIAINTGCLNQCTYCKTKHARGELGSYPPNEIVQRAVQSFQEGVVEIWLTSEDTGAYGRDIGVTLPQLLWKLVDVIPDGCMLRLGMTNPPYILEHLEEMAKILSHPRVYSFLHVPVQAASDNVLLDMKREYTCADFEHVVDFLKDRVPGCTIATDLICGFPTETEEDFEETMDLVAKYKFPRSVSPAVVEIQPQLISLFINQFFPRPGTPAAKMERIPANIVKQRTKKVSELFQSYHPYDHKIGETQQVLITEYSTDRKYFVGHNKFYDQVLVPMEGSWMGKKLTVVITEAGKHYMKCRLADGTTIKRPDGVPEPLTQGQISGITTDTRDGEKIKSFVIASLFIALISVALKLYYKTFIRMIT